MIVVDTFSLADAHRLDFSKTIDLALHAEWQLERRRSLFLLFKAKQVAGEHIVLDAADCARTVALLEWRKELLFKTIKALSDPKPVEEVGLRNSRYIERKFLLL